MPVQAIQKDHDFATFARRVGGAGGVDGDLVE
jgi:hypothetical protein